MFLSTAVSPQLGKLRTDWVTSPSSSSLTKMQRSLDVQYQRNTEAGEVGLLRGKLRLKGCPEVEKNTKGFLHYAPEVPEDLGYQVKETLVSFWENWWGNYVDGHQYAL